MLDWKHTDDKTKITITITLDAAEVISDYLLRKMMGLEAAHLEDSYCYPRSQEGYYAILHEQCEAEKNISKSK